MWTRLYDDDDMGEGSSGSFIHANIESIYDEPLATSHIQELGLLKNQTLPKPPNTQNTPDSLNSNTYNMLNIWVGEQHAYMVVLDLIDMISNGPTDQLCWVGVAAL